MCPNPGLTGVRRIEQCRDKEGEVKDNTPSAQHISHAHVILLYSRLIYTRSFCVYINVNEEEDDKEKSVNEKLGF